MWLLLSKYLNKCAKVEGCVAGKEIRTANKNKMLLGRLGTVQRIVDVVPWLANVELKVLPLGMLSDSVRPKLADEFGCGTFFSHAHDKDKLLNFPNYQSVWTTTNFFSWLMNRIQHICPPEAAVWKAMVNSRCSHTPNLANLRLQFVELLIAPRHSWHAVLSFPASGIFGAVRVLRDALISSLLQ